ncbi:VIT1/CCC1 transporter family protein [Paraburkholderia silvatlantica]|uniref:VIT1/CCC1 family predicted Fe2+/Mn2+ transporter n=1 Tax=Paraburkholderia silvatlantica TaxID=321895 RepID=A0A2U1AGD3_9BURK|nr:VIT1/CCC1 transporter family protein [Paraburkholderia silvatlantica]MBB2928881.1 VIT1/CCC1 family predicted Fe2+/Mn2+ transporter [Paraburkholderia silvatlantica]PVY35463.1 VIT1/CCC1 family predicted Fe2+/Mn2+ transporter [Paraburkholderia silvatlantica]PXW41105.1 VIT1/CCC1 family predicted Fe2+/Mn2+ transporter [Paraburkholderia silvatlantica]PYE27571.1 VIT1/CCC1 family predicted Fe2+/Mn2+ transporter [Paraburkholderia silvatlantica]TDQ98068.1 VIT1/CCC1 family predicted Fe2+/Mn2+ transpor
MASAQEINRFRRNLADELDSAAVYDTLSAVEKDDERRRIFAELAASEREHASVWREKLAANGVTPRPHRRSAKTRLLQVLTRTFGPSLVLPTVAAAEYADRDRYAREPGAERLSAQEQQHAAIVQAIAANKREPGHGHGEAIGAAESWHKGVTSGNDLRAAVLGANDGLVSNFCLIMGVAGAGSVNRTILLTGLAGLVAGACSMALGEWLSVTNARELARTQLAKEADELEHTPDAERHELALIYQAKGVEPDEARRVAAQIMRNKDEALNTLAREELGIDPKELGGNPWSAAAVSFCLFSLGAAFPTAPFLWAHGVTAIAQSVALSACGLALVGVFTSLFNGRSATFSAFRQIVIGLAAAAFTAGAGRLLGVSLS